MKHPVRDLFTFAAGVTAAAILLWAGLATQPDPSTVFRGPVSSLQELAGFAAAAAGLALALWWGTVLILAVLWAALQKAGHAAAAGVAGALAPAFMKRLAAAAIGLHLATGIGAAQAAETFSAATRQSSSAQSSSAQSLSALPGHRGAAMALEPDPAPEPPAGQDSRPPADAAAAAGTAPDQFGAPATPLWQPRTPGAADNVFIRPGRTDDGGRTVVSAGDSLWALAAADLGPQATDTEIAAHWPRWYERNRAVIGNQPDLILPGQVLEPPAIPPAPGQPGLPETPGESPR